MRLLFGGARGPPFILRAKAAKRDPDALRPARRAQGLVLRGRESSKTCSARTAGRSRPVTLGSLSGLCEELKRFLLFRVVDPAEPHSTTRGRPEEDDPARPADGTVTPVRCGAGTAARKLGSARRRWRSGAAAVHQTHGRGLDVAGREARAGRRRERSDADAEGEDGRVNGAGKLCVDPDRATDAASCGRPVLPDPAAQAAGRRRGGEPPRRRGRAAKGRRGAGAAGASARCQNSAIRRPREPPAGVALVSSRGSAKELGRLEVTCRARDPWLGRIGCASREAPRLRDPHPDDAGELAAGRPALGVDELEPLDLDAHGRGRGDAGLARHVLLPGLWGGVEH